MRLKYLACLSQAFHDTTLPFSTHVLHTTPDLSMFGLQNHEDEGTMILQTKGNTCPATEYHIS